MITVTYTAKRYKPEEIAQRYVRRDPIGDGYTWCEQWAKNKAYDLRQGTCDASDLPDDVRAAADAQRKQYFGSVEWPLSAPQAAE